jgi:phosphinothricin acetyltransferase
MHLRTATVADAEALRSIYNREVLETTHTFDLEARSLEEQQQWIRERDGALGVVVAEIDGVVAGFASLSPYRPRAAYRTSVESSVYVAESARGAGVGRTLMHEMIDVATQRGFHTVIARISGGHEASIRLHQSCGFAVVGTEREVGRKFGKWLDVVVMQRMLA